MNIIVKFTLKNIKEKKLRTFLILISIILSSALFFASTAISTTVEEMILQQMRKYVGSSDIMVTAGYQSNSSFFSPSLLDNHKNQMKYVVGMVEGSGEYKKKEETLQVQLQGIELDDLEKMNPIVLEQQSNLYPFKGNKAIIGKNMADKYGLKLDDPMGINMNGTMRWFVVSGISQPMGPFETAGDITYLIVPRDTLAGFYGGKGRVSVMYAALEDHTQQDAMIQELTVAYPKYSVRPTIPRAQLKQQTQEISNMFLVIVTFVLILSMFIIFTSFKVIMAERLPVIGTFRSIGATRKMTNIISLVESLIYGIIGGAIGVFLGIGILHLMINQIIPPEMTGGGSGVHYTLNQMINAFVVGVVLAFASALIPIHKVSKLPVKDVVLNKVEEKFKKRRWKTIVGTCFLILGITGPFVAPEDVAIAVNIVSMFLLVPAVVLLVPQLTKLFLKVFQKVYEVIFGNEGILAVQNLRDNKNITNNIVLLGISIAVVMMITVLSQSIANDLTNHYKNYKYDINLWMWPMNRSVESRLIAIDGVEDTYGIYSKHGTEIVGMDAEIRMMHSADKEKMLHYLTLETKDDPYELLSLLGEERSIIVTNLFKKEHGIQKGDYLKLKTPRGVLPYKVVGFFESDRFNGSFAYLGTRYMKSDMQTKQYNHLYIKTNKDTEEVVEEIREKFKRWYPFVRSLEQEMRENMESSKKILGIFQGFGILTLIIGIFGVFNNLIISFIDRKQSLAIYRSVGMNKKQSIKMIFIEALTGGSIGGLVGIITGMLLIWGVGQVISALGGGASEFIIISWEVLAGALVVGIVITVVASVGPALRTSKLNIIEAIKYE